MFNNISPHPRTVNRQGASAVEFALVVPLLFMFIFAAIEFSRTNMIRNMCENAAMEGARAGIVPGATALDCQNAAMELMDIMRIQGGTVEVTPDPITISTAEITVTVLVPLTENALPMSEFVLGKTLAQTVTLPREMN